MNFKKLAVVLLAVLLGVVIALYKYLSYERDVLNELNGSLMELYEPIPLSVIDENTLVYFATDNEFFTFHIDKEYRIEEVAEMLFDYSGIPQGTNDFIYIARYDKGIYKPSSVGFFLITRDWLKNLPQIWGFFLFI